jgi:bifunctional non-homologous end joining protein LigD
VAAKRDQLDEYRSKRSFDSTPEPGGGPTDAGGGSRFVIQEHHATRLHWDLRLERDGVLASWALPRGVPRDPDRNRLAVHTEDHPLEYLDFHGEIPKGEYGGGSMRIWDRGTYEAEKWEPGKVVVRLEGERVRGRHALFRTGGKNWIIHRMDPPEPGDPFPQRIEPMLASQGRLPREDADWGLEVRWQGLRAIAYCDTGHVEVEAADGEDLSARFRELGAIALELGGEPVVLDGELVVFGADGRPSEGGLKRRLEAGSDSAIRRLRREHPATLVIFDLLYADRASLLDVPYEQRRRRLDELNLDGPAWQVPAYHRGDGRALLAAAAERGLDGVVAKRLASPYRAGKRSRDWREVTS